MLNGIDTQLLWGSDYPHLEGTFVYQDDPELASVTRLSLRNTFCNVPEAERVAWSVATPSTSTTSTLTLLR